LFPGGGLRNRYARTIFRGNADGAVPQHQKNKRIVTLLYHQGIFKLKNAVQRISGDLGISKNTVYLHIRSLEAGG
jgi:predicted transcriptional regulator YheO